MQAIFPSGSISRRSRATPAGWSHYHQKGELVREQKVSIHAVLQAQRSRQLRPLNRAAALSIHATLERSHTQGNGSGFEHLAVGTPGSVNASMQGS